MNPKALHLDRRLEGTSPGVSVGYASGSTTWTLPYSVAVDGSEGVLAVVRRDTGEVLPSTRPSGTQVRAAGDYRSVPVFIGILYDFVYRPTRLFLRNQEGVPETRGRLQLRYLDVHFSSTTDLTVRVAPQGRRAAEHHLNSPEPKSGTIRVPIQARNTSVDIEMVSSGPGAVSLTGLDWEGFYTTRARRM